MKTAASAQKLLDKTKRQLEWAPTTPGSALDSLVSDLRALKREQAPREWNATVEECRTHSLRMLLHQDPLSARAYARPRGYQGDAELLDMIYTGDYRPFCSVPVTQLGDAIFRYTIQCKAPKAVRIRRDFLVTQIDEVCESIPSAHILSVACGHLREAEFSDSMQNLAFGRFVGLDQDPDSLKVVTQTCGALGVEADTGFCQDSSVRLFCVQ